MSIPFNNLKAQLAPQEDDLRAAFERVLKRGWYLMGPEVKAFEQEFAAWVGTNHCVSLNSGTDALVLALKALDCEGGEVVLPAHTALPCYHAVLAAGCIPVFAEVNEQSYCISPQSAARLITDQTRAVIGVHLYGHPCDLDALEDLCHKRGVAFIEDCAQAHGAASGGRTVGTVGDLSAYSFYPTKNLGALGDAGAVCGSSAEADQALRLLRQYGESQRYECTVPGVNSRMDELQAAFLRERLKHMDRLTAERRMLADIYDEGLSGLPVITPAVAEGCEHVYHLYVIRSQRRDELAAFLAGRGIGTGLHYPIPGHKQALFTSGNAPYRADELAQSEQLAAEILSLPLFPGLAPEQADEVCSAIHDFHQS
ncbi:DegT/DnrJ/EryC1/StrS family aminotransferase [Desulfovibrio ferrophilus]|uniref:DegT/DnrJ/EryC1/StrS aminotransferase n=1 Tax=Desulfovibrio ferrophilus TaxID=241368 RepID=A0A2Z6AYF1_9BACT|nr:DegT/DnrJ/EryC1/StrS family aminotransferase [Desulfovibrio ferrophilus]BBD08248.1 DegT/DnrJ/EryC1/StrS aminotransferase [Desulfovibrio ferrophilus]